MGVLIRKILNGERSPSELVKLRDGRLRATEKEVASALEGDYRDEHIFMLKQSYEAYEFEQNQILECDREIKNLLDKLNKKIDSNLVPPPPATDGTKRSNSNQPNFNLRPYLYEAFGVDLTQVHGLQSTTVLTLLTEVGTDLSKWETDKHFKSWLGLCVNKEISGGKILKNKTRKVSNRAAAALRMAATSLKNSNSYLGAFYRRIRARAGGPKAVTATAAKLAVIFYNMVKNQKEYKALDINFYDENYKKRVYKNLKKRAMNMGYELVPIEKAI